MQDRAALSIVPVGIMEYRRCLALQHALHARLVKGEADGGYLLVVEHPPVLTFGKHADKKFLLFAADFFAKNGVSLVDTDRGGEVTAHMPGQLVLYPILRLADFKLSPRRLVEALERAVMKVLGALGIKGGTLPEHPGVWVGDDKVCAIGIRIKDRVSMHGIALNVSNDLGLFGQIVPCGIRGKGVTSINQLGRADASVDALAPRLCAAFAEAVGAPAPTSKTLADLQWQDGDFKL